MKKYLLFFVIQLISFGAVAGNCDWATQTPPDDEKYQYFVAKSYSESSASDAANKAEQDIDSQLGRLFGTKLNVQSEFYSDTTNADATTRAYERTIGIITLKGLERQKSDTEKISGGWTGCVQYRYLKSEINKEKKRLNNLSADELNTPSVFTEVVGDIQCKGGSVEVITNPQGAYVTIDNGKYQGSAPIKFGNVCNGSHTIEITKENYVPVVEKLIVPSKNRISKTLKRDSKQITVRTSLGNSEIEINGVNKGKEPVKFNAPLGLEQTITAINSESVTITRTRKFSKDSDSDYTIQMEKLPGRLDFSAFIVRNPGVRITLDGKEIKGDRTDDLSSEITHKLKFSKNGFYEINQKININGGETTYFPSHELSFSKEPDATFGVLGGIGFSAANNNFGFNLDLGMDYKTKYLYMGITGQLNYIKLSETEMSYVYYNNKHNANINLAYWEILNINLGVNIGKRISVFGIGTLGGVNISGETDAAFNISEKMKPVFRYGIGLQYYFPGEKREKGIRLSYLTGKLHLSPSDINFSHYNNYDKTPINISERNFDNYPKNINSFNITFFIRGVFNAGGKYVKD